MELYKAIKWRKQAKKDEEAYLASEPPITPGFYGNIPPSFTLNLGGFGDSNLAYYFICGPGPKPLCAVSGYTGARLVTLHQNVDLKSAPLAYVTVPKAGQFKLHGVVSVPAPPGSQESVASIAFDSTGGIMDPIYQFKATVGSGKSLHLEQFSWRQTGNWKKQKQGDQRIFELTRNSDRQEASEKVARWQEDTLPAEGRMGSFQLIGSGASGELGGHWKLVAVVSILGLARMQWAAEKMADQMIERGGKALGNVALMGVGFAA